MFLVLLMAALTGCSVPREKFDCPYGKGVGCRSISAVNQDVNEGKLPHNAKQDKAKSKVVLKENISIEDGHFGDDLNVQRVSEQHLRVWVAPYQDEQGHFHEDAIIHVVLRPGFWQVN
jgi:conjugal transfer pilus assembly protein TraV